MQHQDKPSEDAYQTGLFYEDALPTIAEYDEIQYNAEKSASEMVNTLVLGMLNEGALDVPQVNEGNPYFASYVAARISGEI